MILINLTVKGPRHLHPKGLMDCNLHRRADDVAWFVEVSTVDMSFVAEKPVKMDDHLSLFIVTDASLPTDEFGQMIEVQFRTKP